MAPLIWLCILAIFLIRAWWRRFWIDSHVLSGGQRSFTSDSSSRRALTARYNSFLSCPTYVRLLIIATLLLARAAMTDPMLFANLAFPSESATINVEKDLRVYEDVEIDIPTAHEWRVKAVLATDSACLEPTTALHLVLAKPASAPAERIVAAGLANVMADFRPRWIEFTRLKRETSSPRKDKRAAARNLANPVPSPTVAPAKGSVKNNKPQVDKATLEHDLRNGALAITVHAADKTTTVDTLRRAAVDIGDPVDVTFSTQRMDYFHIPVGSVLAGHRALSVLKHAEIHATWKSGPTNRDISCNVLYRVGDKGAHREALFKAVKDTAALFGVVREANSFKQSNVIIVTMANPTATAELIEAGEVSIGGGVSILPSRKQWHTLGHPYELYLDQPEWASQVSLGDSQGLKDAIEAQMGTLVDLRADSTGKIFFALETLEEAMAAVSTQLAGMSFGARGSAWVLPARNLNVDTYKTNSPTPTVNVSRPAPPRVAPSPQPVSMPPQPSTPPTTPPTPSVTAALVPAQKDAHQHLTAVSRQMQDDLSAANDQFVESMVQLMAAASLQPAEFAARVGELRSYHEKLADATCKVAQARTDLAAQPDSAFHARQLDTAETNLTLAKRALQQAMSRLSPQPPVTPPHTDAEPAPSTADRRAPAMPAGPLPSSPATSVPRQHKRKAHDADETVDDHMEIYKYSRPAAPILPRADQVIPNVDMLKTAAAAVKTAVGVARGNMRHTLKACLDWLLGSTNMYAQSQWETFLVLADTASASARKITTMDTLYLRSSVCADGRDAEKVLAACETVSAHVAETHQQKQTEGPIA